MFGLGTTELVLIVVVLVLLFGAKKIPDLARGLGESVRHLRNSFKDDEDKK
jgi:sec-independent protein translocase protein TatA